MAAGVDAFASVTEQADKLLAQLDRPHAVESITTSVGEDEDGDTALFIQLHLSRDGEMDIRKLLEFQKKAQIHLMANGITYFPYVFLEAA